MSFRDSSAIIPLVVRQEPSAALRALAADAPAVVASWLAPVECWSALARLVRGGVLSPAAQEQSLALLASFFGDAYEVALSAAVRSVAGRLLRVHQLRTLDALQLAAALVAAGDPSGCGFVCLEGRLSRAAQLEGFRVLPRPDDSVSPGTPRGTTIL